MGYPTKIATCCFCGSKAALVLDAGRHELACAQCGAPLHDLKQIPVPKASPTRSTQELRQFPAATSKGTGKAMKVGRKKPKRKSWLKKMSSEVFDLVEDIFD